MSLKYGRDVFSQLARKLKSPSSRLLLRKASNKCDEVIVKSSLKDRKIIRLRIQLEQAKPAKRRKVVQDPNERFMSLAQVLARSNQQPEQRIRAPRQEIELEKESSSESEEETAFTRRGSRIRQLTRRYLERDEAEDESNSDS